MKAVPYLPLLVVGNSMFISYLLVLLCMKYSVERCMLDSQKSNWLNSPRQNLVSRFQEGIYLPHVPLSCMAGRPLLAQWSSRILLASAFLRRVVWGECTEEAKSVSSASCVSVKSDPS